MTYIWTFVDIHKPSGITQGVDHRVITSIDGNEISTATELGRGFLGDDGEMNYPGDGFLLTNQVQRSLF